jgi:hypothetical protein
MTINKSKIDPERAEDGSPYAGGRAFHGEGYRLSAEEEQGAREPSGSVDLQSDRTPPAEHHRDLPPEVGHRAWADAKTGEVHGSGSGDGGGSGGEDYDTGSEGGSGPSLTGAEGRASRAGGQDLGPRPRDTPAGHEP